jgi:hypothetical protein
VEDVVHDQENIDLDLLLPITRIVDMEDEEAMEETNHDMVNNEVIIDVVAEEDMLISVSNLFLPFFPSFFFSGLTKLSSLSLSLSLSLALRRSKCLCECDQKYNFQRNSQNTTL